MKILFGKKKTLYTFLFFSIFLLFGILIFSDYGISIDEDNTRIVGFLSLENILNFFSSDHLIKINEIIFEKKQEHSNLDIVPTSGVVFDLPMAFLELIFKVEDSRNYYLLRHLSNFLIFFTSVYFFFKIVRHRFNSYLMGILGATLLIISPRIFANSFYNNKDIIFMSLFIINIYFAIKFLEKSNIKNAAIFSLTTGLLINIRIFGLILPFLIFLLYIIKVLRHEKNKRQLYLPLLVFIVLTPIFIFLFWPYLWENPLQNLIYSFKYLNAHTLNFYTYYLGEYALSVNLPWHYHLVWIFISTPLLYVVFFVIGFVFIFKRILQRLFKIEKNQSYTDLWRGKKELQDLIFLLIFLIPIIIAIDTRQLFYDGWRHLYFIYPSFLLISLSGFYFIKIVFFKKKTSYLYLFTYILIIPTILWMFKNHPYQNVYFNILAGKSFNENFEMDYFGISNKHALEYIIDQEDKNVKVYSLSTTDLSLSKEIIKKNIRENITIVYKLSKADYIVTNYRDWRGETDPTNIIVPNNFKIVHEIKVDDIPINTIYKK